MKSFLTLLILTSLLTRKPKTLPKMRINPNIKNIFDFKFEDFDLVDYNPHAHIKGKVAI